MSRSNPSNVERAGLQVRCGYCKARAGEWCVSGSGKTASALHDSRQDQTMTIFHLGMLEGLETAVIMLERRAKTPALGREAVKDYRDTTRQALTEVDW